MLQYNKIQIKLTKIPTDEDRKHPGFNPGICIKLIKPENSLQLIIQLKKDLDPILMARNTFKS